MGRQSVILPHVTKSRLISLTSVKRGRAFPRFCRAESKRESGLEAHQIDHERRGGGVVGSGRVSLKRVLGLWPTVLYGLGVTVGAGIYVLVGPAVGIAGINAPFAFVLAAVAMAFTGASFAEFAGRVPVSAGEAAYVRAGFRSRVLAGVVGYLVIATGIVSGAAVSVGSVGYIGLFVPLPAVVLTLIVVAIMGAVACWGIRESIVFAGVMTVIEVGGLLLLIAAGLITEPESLVRLPETVPARGDSAAWSGVFAVAILAVFAFTGFESLANLAEEVVQPERVIPQAIFLTLLITTVLYVLVIWVALMAVPAAELGASDAPLALVFERQTGLPHVAISLIAIVATLNGIIVQFIMASRVLYGLAGQGAAPQVFGQVNFVTRTPLIATVVVVGVAAVLAVLLDLHQLAGLTSRITLVTFVLVNLSLVLIKLREPAIGPEGQIFVVPMWVPVVGFLLSTAFLMAGLL